MNLLIVLYYFEKKQYTCVLFCLQFVKSYRDWRSIISGYFSVRAANASTHLTYHRQHFVDAERERERTNHPFLNVATTKRLTLTVTSFVTKITNELTIDYTPIYKYSQCVL